MCPVCVLSVTWLVVGATSTGGMATLVAWRLIAKREKIPRQEVDQ